jgi:hypothetical protein
MRLFRPRATVPSVKDDDASSTSLNSYQNDDRVSEVMVQLMSGNKKRHLVTVAVDHVPALATDLVTARSTRCQKALRALRRLFALSENAHDDTRKEMARDRILVPNILKFLSLCRSEGSGGLKPQLILALMILNNLSIPVASKRFVAIDHGGAAFLCNLLCEEPSFGLVAIVLVNLTCTFSNDSLRLDLLSDSKIPLVSSLALAFRSATLTKEQYRTRRLSNGTIHERLQYLLACDTASTAPPPTHMQLYPKTARRCLCALQNLTRNSASTCAARMLVETNILPFVLRFLSVPILVTTSFYSLTRCENPEPALDVNDPLAWGDQSAQEEDHTIQDVALFLVLNVSSDPSVVAYLRDNTIAIPVLKSIADYRSDEESVPIAARLDAELQRLKARMALAQLLAAKGNFGQQRSQSDHEIDTRSLEMNIPDASCFLELLCNILQRRSKDGPGGYRAVTFTLKTLLKALRCLLTLSTNVSFLASSIGIELNSLLIRVLGLYSLQKSTLVNADAAEDACFSLYLLSTHGFHVSSKSDYFVVTNQLSQAPFLPTNLAHGYGPRNIVAKVLTALLKMSGITSATRHAANQILLRAKYLNNF